MTSCSLLRNIVGLLATLGFMLLSGFEAGLAIGQAVQPANAAVSLPVYLRISMGLSSILWIYASAIVLHRSGLVDLGFSPEYTKGATYGLAGCMVLGSVLVLTLSPSTEQRWTWGPPAMGLAVLCFMLARVELTDDSSPSRGTSRGNAWENSGREPLLVMAVV